MTRNYVTTGDNEGTAPSNCTLVGAIGTFEDLDFSAVAVLLLAVDEAYTRLIRSATQDATLVVGGSIRATTNW